MAERTRPLPKPFLKRALPWGILLLCLATAASAWAAEMNVSAASSLSEVLPRASKGFEAQHPGLKLRFNFDGTSRIARQIQEGAPADVFVSANQEWMDALVASHHVEKDSSVHLVSNQLVLVVPKAAAQPSGKDLKQLLSGVKRLALAGEAVPISKYARAAFEKLGVWEELRPRIVRGDHVRMALRWAEEGEVDAAVVYATDARASTRVRGVYTFPKDTHPKVNYPAAVTKGARDAGLARALLKSLRGPEAQRVFTEAGFEK